MARKKKENDINNIEEKIIKTEFSDEMRQSFADYSMSVIVSRAIPDIRDGLKPVHRRILYDMKEQGITSDKEYKKCARVVGDTLGKYHPHGDSSVYDALVVMAQDWKKGSILINGHGNFGSIEGDPQAANRYTECKLTQFSEDVFLDDLNKDTVNFVPNFDETTFEPEILPAKMPNVLINGTEGIAVGMATSTPPHNIIEVMNGYKAFIDNNKISTKELMQYVKGPDFPTGGIVANKSELLDMYETGKGKLKIRGKIEFEPAKKKSEKDLLVVTEIPYTMIGTGINKFLSDVAELVKTKKLPEVTDIMNQSSKEGIRLVIELKRDSDIERVKNILYKKTRLEDTFGVNMLYVANGKPEQMGLISVYKHFLDFQIETKTRKYKALLNKELEKAEIQEGLIKAIDIIDLIIEVIRGSKTSKIAKNCLMGVSAENIKFKSKKSEKLAQNLCFTELQAQSILDMKLSRLIGLEINTLIKEHENSIKIIKKYEKIIKSKKEMLKIIKNEIDDMIKKYGVTRKTQLLDIDTPEIDMDIIEEKAIVFGIDKFNYIKTYDETIYEKNKESIDSDNKQIFKCNNTDSICFFTDVGNMHQVKCIDMPLCKAKDKGIPLDNISNFNSSDETIIIIMSNKNLNDKNKFVFITKNGLIKTVNSNEFITGRKTISSTKLKENDKIISIIINPECQIVIGTQNNMFIRFNTEEVPLMKKSGAGSHGIKLKDDDTVIIGTSVPQRNLPDITIGKHKITTTKIKLVKRGSAGNKIKLQK